MTARRTRAEIGRFEQPARKGRRAGRRPLLTRARLTQRATHRPNRSETGDRHSRDRGDIDGTPGLCWQVKTSTDAFTHTAVLGVLSATADQAVASGADYGIAVQRRAGKRDPADGGPGRLRATLYTLVENVRSTDVPTLRTRGGAGPHAAARRGEPAARRRIRSTCPRTGSSAPRSDRASSASRNESNGGSGTDRTSRRHARSIRAKRHRARTFRMNPIPPPTIAPSSRKSQHRERPLRHDQPHKPMTRRNP